MFHDKAIPLCKQVPRALPSNRNIQPSSDISNDRETWTATAAAAEKRTLECLKTPSRHGFKETTGSSRFSSLPSGSSSCPQRDRLARSAAAALGLSQRRRNQMARLISDRLTSKSELLLLSSASACYEACLPRRLLEGLWHRNVRSLLNATDEFATLAFEQTKEVNTD